MNIASILAGFVKLAGLVMEYLGRKQLMDAGAAVERDRLSTEERERINAANRAAVRAGADVDAHGVPDTFYRD